MITIFAIKERIAMKKLAYILCCLTATASYAAADETVDASVKIASLAEVCSSGIKTESFEEGVGTGLLIIVKGEDNVVQYTFCPLGGAENKIDVPQMLELLFGKDHALKPRELSADGSYSLRKIAEAGNTIYASKYVIKAEGDGVSITIDSNPLTIEAIESLVVLKNTVAPVSKKSGGCWLL